MPSDITFEAAATKAPARAGLPLGAGLAIGGGASMALWVAIGLALRALFL